MNELGKDILDILWESHNVPAAYLGYDKGYGTDLEPFASQILNKVAASIKVRREYAFRQAGYGSREHRLRFQAKVDMCDLILGDLKGGE